MNIRKVFSGSEGEIKARILQSQRGLRGERHQERPPAYLSLANYRAFPVPPMAD